MSVPQYEAFRRLLLGEMDQMTPSVQQQIKEHIAKVRKINQQHQAEQVFKAAVNRVKLEKELDKEAFTRFMDGLRDKLGDGLFTQYNYCLILVRHIHKCCSDYKFSLPTHTVSLRKAMAKVPKVSNEMLRQIDDPNLNSAMSNFLIWCHHNFDQDFSRVSQSPFPGMLGIFPGPLVRIFGSPIGNALNDLAISEDGIVLRLMLADALIRHLKRYSEDELIFIVGSANVDLNRELAEIERWRQRKPTNVPQGDVLNAIKAKIGKARTTAYGLLNS